MIQDCYLDLKNLRIKHGTSVFDGAVKKLMRERVSPEREKRKHYPKSMYQRLFDRASGQCSWCMNPLAIPAYKTGENGNEIDHFQVDASDFGGERNLQLLHSKCNREKSSKTVIEQSKEKGRTFVELIPKGGNM